MWRYEERSIDVINKDRRSSLKSGGTQGDRIFQQIIFKMT